MRIYLDSTVVRWLREAFGRPYSFDRTADDMRWRCVDARIETDSHGSYLNLAKPDDGLLDWLMRHLILKGAGRTYGRAFRRIATQIAEHEGASAVDRLGELVRETQAPTPVRLGRKDPRTRAVDRIAKRTRGRPDPDDDTEQLT